MMGNRAMQSRLIGSTVSRRRRISSKLSMLLSAVAEGFDKARRYQSLSSCTERELAALRVTYQDLPRFVMFGGYDRAVHGVGMARAIARTDNERSFSWTMSFSAFGLASSLATAPLLRPEDVAIMAQFLG
jgi:hypothetical protein